jgi:hypothetical protein
MLCSTILGFAEPFAKEKKEIGRNATLIEYLNCLGLNDKALSLYYQLGPCICICDLLNFMSCHAFILKSVQMGIEHCKHQI